jgi:hypothetical protein
MDLREAIKKFEGAASADDEHQQDFQQIVAWLKELRVLRKQCSTTALVQKKDPEPLAWGDPMSRQQTGMTFAQEELEIIRLGLAMRRNMVETGDPMLSSEDVRAGHKPKDGVRSLSEEQMRLVLQVRDLERRFWEL